jgi:hypothetical protein
MALAAPSCTPHQYTRLTTDARFATRPRPSIAHVIRVAEHILSKPRCTFAAHCLTDRPTATTCEPRQHPHPLYGVRVLAVAHVAAVPSRRMRFPRRTVLGASLRCVYYIPPLCVSFTYVFLAPFLENELRVHLHSNGADPHYVLSSPPHHSSAQHTHPTTPQHTHPTTPPRRRLLLLPQPRTVALACPRSPSRSPLQCCQTEY